MKCLYFKDMLLKMIMVQISWQSMNIEPCSGAMMRLPLLEKNARFLWWIVVHIDRIKWTLCGVVKWYCKITELTVVQQDILHFVIYIFQNFSTYLLYWGLYQYECVVIVVVATPCCIYCVLPATFPTYQYGPLHVKVKTASRTSFL